MAPTSSRRTYDTSGRRAAAERNRDAVLRACHDLVLRDGYRATTIRAVAERAGVSIETIYKSFGGKQQLMKAVYDVTLAGDSEPVPIGRRAEVRAAFEASGPQDKVVLYARFVTGLMERLSGLIAVLTEADPDIARIRATTEEERLIGVRAFVDHLAKEGHLRAGTAAEHAADACWVLTSPQLFAQLTLARGWDADGYRHWLTEMLAATLLEP
ncbi:TetR/AcrR family transcriptional regulator [Actinophytocola sp.]|uniref:TetR/AcrR family transcriptional regulator n=1 Tax=Actinophytocola sp. TaxID=1872138 RepID=UPI002ED92010